MSKAKPSFLKRLRNLLPPTERAMENRQAEFNKRVDDLHRQINYLQETLEFNAKALQTSIETNGLQTRVLLWEIMHKDGESLVETKKRFFRSLPEATGAIRVLQLANAKILHDFNAFCKEHGLTFFLAWGTLLGAYRHGGPIPWDDDLDVGMMRSEFKKLEQAILENDRFILTTVYDQWNCCKQVRFKYADESIPCFIDVFYFDFASDLSDKHNLLFAQQRAILEDEIHQIEQSYIDDPQTEGSENDFKFIPSTNPLSAQLNKAVDTAVKKLYEAEVFCEEEQARFLRWGVENMAYGESANLALTDVFPLSEVSFDGELYPAPHNIEAVLTCWFGDWLDLPNDLLSHPVHTTITDETLEALSDFVALKDE